MRTRLAALAGLFLAAHLALLPPSLEDVDSINFALGVREYDVARHQPHPPGYPVFIALAKVTTGVLRAVGVPAAEARGLAVWSALAGAALIPLLLGFFRALGSERRAWWATIVVAGAPLFWFTALRPLSDTLGLAFAVAALGLLAPVALGTAPGRTLAAGAFVAALAVGVRSQTAVLTVPLALWAFLLPGRAIAVRERAMAVFAATAGAAIWFVPLIVASGGPSSYLAALGSQAGEDFSGVVILWTFRSARVAVQALGYTLLWPWGTPWLGGLVVALAAIGGAVLLWRSPRVALAIGVIFAPYALFHLLFHEIVTVRYALPIVVPVAYLLVVALDAMPPRVLPAAASILAGAGIVIAAVPSWTYARQESPAFRAVRDVAPGEVVAMHAFARRVAEWHAGSLAGRALMARHGEEWLRAVEHLRYAPAVAFLADPRRTDLALFDPQTLRRAASYTWGFREPAFVGGARPGHADLYRLSSPGWMLERGWALTAEVAGVSERDGSGPHRTPSLGWIAGRAGSATLVIGGRHLGAAGDPPVEFTLVAGEAFSARWTAPPGFFVKRFDVPPGVLKSTQRYVPLAVASRAADGSAREVRTALEQFDLQGPDVPMFAFEDGWHEPEYNPLTAVAWRWMSDRAQLWVRAIGRDVTLSVWGESPSRYYDDPATLGVAVGETPIAEWRPSRDFVQQITLPRAALAAANGRVVITSDRHHVPAEAGRSADARRLATRIYRVAVW